MSHYSRSAKYYKEDFDSIEEWEFYNWLLEGEKHGFISQIQYQPITYQLSKPVTYRKPVQLKTKVAYKTRALLSGCSYTPDFSFKVCNNQIQSFLKNKHTIVYDITIVDVKGSFAGKNNSSAVTFPIKAKWLYQTYGIFIQKVVPEKLFKLTWVPEVARLSPKKKQPVKKYIGCKTIIEFIENQSKQQ